MRTLGGPVASQGDTTTYEWIRWDTPQIKGIIRQKGDHVSLTLTVGIDRITAWTGDPPPVVPVETARFYSDGRVAVPSGDEWVEVAGVDAATLRMLLLAVQR